MTAFNRLIIFLTLIIGSLAGLAQPKLEFQLKKPKQYEERQLGSEKMADKKFTAPRKFFQNTFTHYNYYFLANEKIKSIVDYARQSQKDDYTQLLSFYPYSLDITSRSGDIDSILLLCNAGILLHDLRNSWIDNLYLTMGKAYLLRKDYDSAVMSFQYLNYAYSPKEKGGYDQPIGSNSVEGSNALSISTKEKPNVAQKVFSKPPSRNESFVWMIRTLTEQGNYLDASSLVSTLRNDPVFPERLRPELYDAMAYLYYKVEQWDSAGTYLEKSFDVYSGPEEKARAYYVMGQCFQMAKMHKEAVDAFANCSKTAVDPVMDIYARLNTIRLRKSDDPNIIDQNIADLKALAKKDRYTNYRDIIYYAAAMFEMERQGYDAADGYLQQSIHFNTDNPAQRSQSFMLMGDARYSAKKYGAAFMPYDSVATPQMKHADSLRVETRRPNTKPIYEADKVISLQDSLLKIAAMPEEARTAYVKNLSKQLRKERGLKEEIYVTSGSTNTSSDLFTAGQGTWYFNDAARRANGFNAFRQKWGDRPNTDNWRRSSAISIKATITNTQTVGNPDAPLPATTSTLETETFDTTDISFDNLYSRLPISEERKVKANSRITNALFVKANALHEKVEDYPEAIKVYEQILSRIDTGQMVAQTLFALIHCYAYTGDLAKATETKKRLQKQFPNDTLTAKTMGNVAAKQAEKKDDEITKAYQHVYDLYLEGSFQKAADGKRDLDSKYGRTYWTPQLLYIETVYLLKSKQDSLAMKNLDAIIQYYPDHPLAAKAKVIKEILPKRKEIEEYLTKLDIRRVPDEKVTAPQTTISTAKPSSTQKQTTAAIVPNQAPKPVIDSSKNQLKAAPPTEIAAPYTIRAEEAQVVAIVLENVDPAYVNEATYSLTNSPRTNAYNATVSVEKKKLRDKLFLILLRSPSFTNATTAYDYITYLKPMLTKEIITWLEANKYRFIIVSETNLDLLSQDPKLDVYEKVLKQTFPGKF